jgi:membrane-bound lytic murein transglycosylase F
MVPRTAREVGVKDLFDPEQSIRGGTLYLRRLIDRFPKELPLASRIRFALASYNAGYGHVTDGRRLARRQGLEPDLWYGNVERAMLMLQRPEHYRKTRFGFCRGSETVKYVQNIDRYYQTFLELIPDE